ncbi:MAG: alkaline phosphatase [Saprospiraceae bacterium]
MKRTLHWGKWILLGVVLSHCKAPERVIISIPPAQDSLPPPAVVFMVGDGMGLSQVSAAMYQHAMPLHLEQFPIIGFQKTFAASDLVTDSAAGATAFACGKKTFNGAVGVSADTLPCRSLMEEAIENGLATGVVVTSSLVHATPAAFMAHRPMRVQYEEIAEDIAYSGVDFLVGGGKRYFDRRKHDDRDLLAEMQLKGYMVNDYFGSELHRIQPDSARRFIYLTADDQPLPVSQGRNYLTYATQLGLDFLNKKAGDKGFFLLVEGSQIDWANHANEGKLAIQETLDFDRAIGKVLEFARQRGNTLVIVTADHESGGMAVQNGSKKERVKVAFTTNGHTATMVPVFAFGPGAAQFSGIYDNTAIHDKIRAFLAWPPQVTVLSIPNPQQP